MSEIEIKIRRKHPRPRSSESQRGPVDFRREADYLARRIQSGFLNFWDLGQVTDGSGGFVDLDFSVVPTIAIVSGDLEIETFDAHWSELYDAVFTFDPVDWKTKYKKLVYEEAERYGVDVFDNDTGDTYPAARNGSRLDINGHAITDTKWQSQGLKLPPGVVNFGLVSNGAFAWFDNGTFIKITSDPLYTAPSVSFSLAKNADVFLMPYIITYTGFSVSTLPLAQTLVGRYGQLKRSVWLPINFSDSGFPVLSVGTETLSAPDKAAILTEAKISARNFEDDGSGLSEVSPSTFPLYPDATLGDGLREIGDPYTSAPAGVLLGAILQHNQMYYFWSNAVGGTVIRREIPLN